MFSSANTFNSNLSNWDTSNVTNMSDMFSGSTAFNGDISSWDTGKVTTMSRMFSDASTFSADLSNWNTGSVTNMGYMFVNARAFDSNLGSWDLRALTDLSYMLSRSGLSETHYDATLVGWAAQLVPTGLTLNAADLQYCAAQAARQQLIDVSHWVIAGDRSCDDVVVEKKITGVSFTTGANSELILKITGDSLVDSDSFEHIDALSRSLVSLNSTPLKTCAFGGMTASEITAAFSGVYPNVGANVTDDQPCYYIVASDGNTAAITMTQALIWLPPTFDTTAQGTVSVNGSPVYTFNQQTTPGVDEPTAIVENKPLTGVPVIPKRPHFSGTAEPGATVTVTVHSDPISCTALADSNGNWSCQLPSDLEPGQHTVNIHVVLPGGGTQDLGPYTVTVNPDGTSTPITNTTLLAPNTGFAQTVKTLTTQPQGLILLATLLAALGVGGMVVRERRRS